MKRIFPRVLLVLTILLIVLLSCEKNTSFGTTLNQNQNQEKSSLEVQADAELYYENMYRFDPFATYSDSTMTMYDLYMAGDTVYMSGHVDENPGTRLFEYDYDGNCVADYNCNFSQVAAFGVDRYLYGAEIWGEEMFVTQMDQSSTELAHSDVCKVASYGTFQDKSKYGKDIKPRIEMLAEDCIIAYYGYDMYIFRNGVDSQPVYVDLPGAIDGMERLSKEELLIFSGSKPNSKWDSLYHKINMETGEIVEYAYDAAHPEPRFENTVNIIRRSDAYYAMCKDGLYVQYDDTAKLIVSWEESYLDYRNITLLHVIDEDKLIIRYQNVMLNQDEFGYFSHVTEKREKPRELITMASIGLCSDYRSMLHDAVREFNRESPEYIIYYRDYYDFDNPAWMHLSVLSEEDQKRAQQDFEFDIIEGKIYDCYIFPDDSPNRKMLADKNALIDLMPYLESEQLLGCVERAYVSNGKSVALPFFINVTSLATNQNVLPSTEPFTYEKLYEMAASLKPCETLFCDDMTDDLIKAGQYEHLDFDSHDCSFESESYKRYLEFLKKTAEGQYTDEEQKPMLAFEQALGGRNTLSWQRFMIASREGIDGVANGSVKLTRWTFATQDSLVALMFAYNQQRINYCGFPYEDGTGIILSADALFSITSTAQNPDGAAAFMNYMYGKKLQTCERMQRIGLPASKEGMKAIFPVGFVHFYSSGGQNTVFTAWSETHGTSTQYRYSILDQPMDLLSMDKVYCFRYIHVTKEDRDLFIRFLDRAKPISVSDTVISDIIKEEISYYIGGVRDEKDTAKIIQGRVRLYLNE